MIFCFSKFFLLVCQRTKEQKHKQGRQDKTLHQLEKEKNQIKKRIIFKVNVNL